MPVFQNLVHRLVKTNRFTEVASPVARVEAEPILQAPRHGGVDGDRALAETQTAELLDQRGYDRRHLMAVTRHGGPDGSAVDVLLLLEARGERV